MEALNGQVTSLNETIATRDGDLADLQKKLEAAGEDATKLAELNNSMSALQEKYDADTKSYQDKLRQQSYEFAVKEYANSQHFSSKAAKRDFIKAMIDKNLQMEGDKLIGGDDFRAAYATDNEDAFYVEPEPASEPEYIFEEDSKPTEQAPIPTMVASTPGASTVEDESFDFGIVGVRAHE